MAIGGRILSLSPTPILFLLPDLGGGGAQRVMLQIAGGIDRVRFAPRLMVLGGSQDFAPDVPSYLELENGGARRLRDGIPWLVRRIRAIEPAACISVMGYLNLALLGLKPLLPKKTRLIVREANALAATINALPHAVPGRALYRALYPKADAIICPTREIGDELSGVTPRMAARVSIIPNPVDVDALRARATPPKRHPGAGLRFVSAGRLTEQKGYDRLVGLLTEFPAGSHVMVFGDGADRARLEQQAQALGVQDRVTFATFTRDLPAWIAGADSFLLPSRWEGLPNVVLESLAIGTPAIISDQVAVRELAQSAAPGAIEICKVGPDFVAAAAHVSVGDRLELRPSLLPAAYIVENVIQSWDRLLSDLLASASLQ